MALTSRRQVVRSEAAFVTSNFAATICIAMSGNDERTPLLLKEREARFSQQGELRMKRPGIMTISFALAMGLATAAWAAEGAGSGTSGGSSGTGRMESGRGMNV